MPRRFRPALAALAALLSALPWGVAPAAQTTVVKYGADFLASGVGARALGMGGAYVAHAGDVTAGYWNVAGLDRLQYPEGAYMHAERFGGIVAFDYAAVAVPLSARSTVGVSFVRSAVDDIASTLAALNPDTGLPYPNPENHITYFSAADQALFVSYARRVREGLSLGASAKIVRRGIGDFASAWGYSLDVGAQYRLGRVQLGAQLQDVTGMVQAWSVNDAAFADFETIFGQDRPIGLTEVVLPVARLGAASVLPLTEDVGLTLAADLDLAFDGQRANLLNAGDVSFQPRVGGEVSYRDLVAFRAGLSNLTVSERYGTQVTPSVGVGLVLGPVTADYGFGDFGGVPGDLGYAHRVSVTFRLAQERYARQER